MLHTRLAPPIAAAFVLASASTAHAGMPAVTLTDVAQLRLSVISFFLLGLALSSAAIWLIWNWLAKDFTWLPRLSFAKAGALVTLWGLLFVVVLAMISGARELMTPAAWRKSGLTYVLDQPKPAPIDYHEILAHRLRARRANLERLSAALQRYAALHEGRYPKTLAEAASTEELRIPGSPNSTYVRLPIDDHATAPQPLVTEPEVFEDGVLVLLTSGEIDQRPFPPSSPRVEGK